MPKRSTPHPNYVKIYAIVRRIPAGRVATYGQVARLAGLPGHARQVGYALYHLAGASDVPWHRVINAKGEISPRAYSGTHRLQRRLLEAEGVAFDDRGRVDLGQAGWSPRQRR